MFTPGDRVDALVAMNPAALKMNVADLRPNGILIVNADSFTENDLRKAQCKTNPLEDHSLDGFRVFPVELEKLTRLALQELGPSTRNPWINRFKNFFALECATGFTTGRWIPHSLAGRQVQEQAAAFGSE